MTYTLAWHDTQAKFDDNGQASALGEHTNGAVCVAVGGFVTATSDNSHDWSKAATGVVAHPILVEDGSGGVAGSVMFTGAPTGSGSGPYLHVYTLEVS